MSLVQHIQVRLEAEFDPITLQIEDDSHLHAGHAGSQGGGQHFSVSMRSRHFEGLTRVQRHQRVYAALEDLLVSNVDNSLGYIHALKLQLDV